MSILVIISLMGVVSVLMGLAVYRQVCTHLELRASLHRYESSFNVLAERLDTAIERLEAAHREGLSHPADIVLRCEEDPEGWGGWTFGVIDCKAPPNYLRYIQMLYGAMERPVINYYLAKSHFHAAATIYSSVSSCTGMSEKLERIWEQEDSPAYT